jgi:hypothetical protein
MILLYREKSISGSAQAIANTELSMACNPSKDTSAFGPSWIVGGAVLQPARSAIATDK